MIVDNPSSHFSIKINSIIRKALLVALSLLPIMDSLNGWINQGGNDSGSISLGIIYRCVLILICGIGILANWKEIKKRQLIVGAIAAILLLFRISDFISNQSLNPELSFIPMTMKLLLPIICVEAMLLVGIKDQFGSRYADTIQTIWAILFPACIIVPSIFDSGLSTYSSGDVGFKGWFFSQNDLCFCLSMLYSYSLCVLVEYKNSRSKLLIHLTGAVLCCICLMLLGLKSGLICIVFFSAGYIAMSKRLSKTVKMLALAAMLVVFLLLLFLMSEQVSKLIERWRYLYDLLGNFPTFITSGRIDRISLAATFLQQEGCSTWLLFGSGLSYTAPLKPYALIEMDFFDLLFQFGLLGALAVYGYFIAPYLQAVRWAWGKLPLHYRFATPIMVGMSLFAGHIFVNSALSGTMVAVLTIGLLSESSPNNNDMNQYKNGELGSES